MDPKALLDLVPAEMRKSLLDKLGDLLRTYAAAPEYQAQVPPGGDVRGTLFARDVNGQAFTFVKFDVSWPSPEDPSVRCHRPLMGADGRPLMAEISSVVELLIGMLAGGALPALGTDVPELPAAGA